MRDSQNLSLKRTNVLGVGITAINMDEAVEILIAARAQGPEAWDAFHWNLLTAMFTDNRNISEISVLCDVADKSGLDEALFRDELASGIHKQQAMKEYIEATNRGVTGIPSVVVNDEVLLVGAVPRDQYKYVIDHVLEHGEVPRQASPGLPQL